MEIFAERLKSLRKERRYTSKEVAEYLGISQRAYLYYESALHYPDVPGLMMLADFFGVTTDYLLGRTEKTGAEENYRIMVKIAERLKALRKERNLRQSDVAKQLGIGVRTYQYYEGDDHRPDYEMLINLADFYDVSIDYLLGRTEER